jgi:hypothetical protein
MVLWLKGFALGFGAGLLTMSIVSFVSHRGAGEGGALEQLSADARVATAASGEATQQRGTSTIAKVQGLVADESAAIPAPGFLDAPPSSEALPAEPARSRRAAELATIDEVRAALIAKNPQAALAQLDRYELTHPEASFGLRAKLLRIEALAVSGGLPAAKELASAFVATHPDSPYAPRLRAFLSGERLPE